MRKVKKINKIKHIKKKIIKPDNIYDNKMLLPPWLLCYTISDFSRSEAIMYYVLKLIRRMEHRTHGQCTCAREFFREFPTVYDFLNYWKNNQKK